MKDEDKQIPRYKWVAIVNAIAALFIVILAMGGAIFFHIYFGDSLGRSIAMFVSVALIGSVNGGMAIWFWRKYKQGLETQK